MKRVFKFLKRNFRNALEITGQSLMIGGGSNF